LLTHFFSSSFCIDLTENHHYYGETGLAVDGGNHYVTGTSGAPLVHFAPYSALQGIIGNAASGLNNLVNREAVNYGKSIDVLNPSLLGTSLHLRKPMLWNKPSHTPSSDQKKQVFGARRSRGTSGNGDRRSW
jgi:hypothetical protein